MTEETTFWGVTVEGYDEGGHPTSILLAWKGPLLTAVPSGSTWCLTL